MFKSYHDCTFHVVGSSITWVSIAALVISLATIFFTVYTAHINKKIDLLNLKFQKFCITGLDKIFEHFDERIESTASVERLKRELTETFVNAQLFITRLKTVYVNINTEEIIRDIEAFTDKFYEVNPTERLHLRSEYYTTKLLLYSKLYDFAMLNEFNFFGRIFKKKGTNKSKKVP